MKIWLILLVLSECLGELVASAAAQAKENRIHEEEVENDGISHRNHRNMQKSRYHSITDTFTHSITHVLDYLLTFSTPFI